MFGWLGEIMEPVCKRCGICCFFKEDGKTTKKPCRYLIKVGERTICRIYKNRLGKDIGNGHHCTTREKDKNNYKGCPLNVLYPEKKIIEEVGGKE